MILLLQRFSTPGEFMKECLQILIDIIDREPELNGSIGGYLKNISGIQRGGGY